MRIRRSVRYLSKSGCCLMMLALLGSFNAWATPPAPPVTIAAGEKLQADRAEGRAVLRLPFSLQSRGAQEQEVQVEVSVRRMGEELQQLEPTPRKILSERRRLRAAKEGLAVEQGVVTLPAPGPGLYQLVLKVAGGESRRGFSDKQIRYVRVNGRGSATLLTPRAVFLERAAQRRARFEEALRKAPKDPDIRLLFENTAKVPDEAAQQAPPPESFQKQQLRAQPTGPSRNLEGYYRQAEVQGWQKRDPITVRGRLMYQDFDGTWKPLVNVSVNVWDDDDSGDEHLGVTGTDWNGDWSLTVNGDDGALQGGRDIYYTFKLENTRTRVENCSLNDSAYEWQSAIHNDLQDGTVLDFGSTTGSTHATAMQMWGHLNNAWNAIVTMSGQDPGFVDSCFPYDDTYWDPFWEEINVEEAYIDGPDAIFHEYGHALMYYAYGDYDPSPGGYHGFDENIEPGGAWSEGWATGWMLMARPDGVYNWHEGDGGREIEAFSSSVKVGERNEGRVAAALVDFFDALNDCNNDDPNLGRDSACDRNAGQTTGLDLIYRQTMWGSSHDDVLQFWKHYSGELTADQLEPHRDIMLYNWMDLTNPSSGSSCVATKVATGALGPPSRAVPPATAEGRDSLLSNLRAFRDHALKRTPGGRKLMATYYRNSPELALVLLKDEKARAAALTVMRHFGDLGALLRQDAARTPAARAQTLLLPQGVEAAARVVIESARRDASPELRTDLLDVERLMDKVRGMTLQDTRVRLLSGQELRAEPVQEVDRDRLNPGSQRALKELPLGK